MYLYLGKRIDMKHLLIALLLLLTFTGCQDKENDAKKQAIHDAKIAAQAKAELLAEIQAKQDQETKQNTTLNQIGIHTNNGIISIDTNKTKTFFDTLNKRMETEMKKISDDLQKGIIEAKEEGIQMQNDHITIDLNKTKQILEVWGQKINIFAQEFDNISKNLDLKEYNATN